MISLLPTSWTAFLSALFAALILTPLVRRIAMGTGFVAVPRSNRLHTTPTPVLGGLALLGALIAGLAASGHLDLGGHMAGEVPPIGSVLLLVGVGAFILGLADDVKDLTPPAKLAGQVVLAMFFLSAGGRGPFTSLEINGAIGLFWVVGLMNACNFIDNMDGTLAAVGLLIAVGLAGLAITHGSAVAPGWLAALAGALLGFFLYNRPPAALFMGDAGSLLVGAALSTAAWAIASSTQDVRVWLAMPLLLAYPIFDISFVTLTRIRRRQPPWLGGCDHTNHRLLTLLGTPVRTLSLVCAIQGLAVIAGLLVASTTVLAAVLTLGSFIAGFGAFGYWLARVPFRSSSRPKEVVIPRPTPLRPRPLPEAARSQPKPKGRPAVRATPLHPPELPGTATVGAHGEAAAGRSTGTDA